MPTPNQSPAPEHTPLPWHVTTTPHQQSGYPYAIIRFAEPWNEVVSAHVRSKEDADLIVRAVNALPLAVSALEAMIGIVEAYAFGWQEQQTPAEAQEAATNARAALRALKPEGKDL